MFFHEMHTNVSNHDEMMSSILQRKKHIFANVALHDCTDHSLANVKNGVVAVEVGAVAVAYLCLETNLLVLGICQLGQRISHLHDSNFKCQSFN